MSVSLIEDRVAFHITSPNLSICPTVSTTARMISMRCADATESTLVLYTLACFSTFNLVWNLGLLRLTKVYNRTSRAVPDVQLDCIQ